MPPSDSSIVPPALAHRPRHTYENSSSISSTLTKPFRPPIARRSSVLPERKKRKITSYAEDTNEESSRDLTYSASAHQRVALGGLDINALKARRQENAEIFRKTFTIPVKESAGIEKRVGCAPSLGMLRPTNFVPRPLHDPAGEFAIVLYDPTIDDETPARIPEGNLPAFRPLKGS